MKHKKSGILLTVVIISLSLAFIITVAAVFNNIRNNLSSEVISSLEEEVEQNISLIRREIDDKFVVLNRLAKELSPYESDEAAVDKMKVFAEVYNFRRMGYVNLEGTAKTTDGFEKDLSFADFVKEGLSGKAYITAAVEDMLGDSDEKVNVISVPVYDFAQKVKGVMFAEYNSESFRNLIFSDSMQGEGSSYVVDTQGNIITSYGSDVSKDLPSIFSYIEGSKASDDGLRRKVLSNMAAGLEDSGVGPNREDTYFFYCYKPLKIESVDVQWYVFSAEPREVLTRRMKPIMNDIQYLIIIIVGLFIVSNIIHIYYNLKRRRELYQLAYVDPVTGGDNFVAFKQKIGNRPGFIVSLDLVEFKLINSVCGVEKGDEVLSEVWKILKENCRGDEICARVNADRFIIFFAEEEKEAVALRIEHLTGQIKTLSESLNIPRVFPVMGIYHTDSLENIDRCYGDALRAKSLVKGRRDKNYAFYDELDHDAIAMNQKLEESFDKALQNNCFEVWYQPKFDAHSEELVGAEALVRWRDEDGSLIPPGRFIPLFEKNGNIIKLDEYVFREVCRQQKQWEKQGIRCIPVSVNISRFSLYYSNVVDKYKRIIQYYEVEPQCVELEITESATIENAEIASLIEQFRDAGFKILLDDFGSGYSSLATLNQMKFDTIKLDKSLVDFIGNDSGEKLLEFIIRLAHSLGIKITAEGVEEQKQVEFLQQLDCDDIQGYYFSKPLMRKDFESKLERRA